MAFDHLHGWVSELGETAPVPHQMVHHGYGTFR